MTRILSNGHPNKFLLITLIISFISLSKSEICNKYCDGRESDLANSPRLVLEISLNNTSTKVSLVMSDEDNMGFALITNGSRGDELWIDRSFDGGISWNDDSSLGLISLNDPLSPTPTSMFNVDNDELRRVGALRACGRSFVNGDIFCTEWARSTVGAETDLEAAATGLMSYYDGKVDLGWHTIGWWNEANALTALIQYIKLTGSNRYYFVIDEVFLNNIGEWDGNFTSPALDDTAWWALAWIEAFDLSQDSKYLDMARFDIDFMNKYIDNVCGGGVWWSTEKTYKNAITNELLILLNAAMHNRIVGDSYYLKIAIELEQWFRTSGMINEENLINDGLRDDCSSNRDTTWTYNQGVILGALLELHTATSNSTYLDFAKLIADAVVNSPILSKNGILTEPCEGSGSVGCGEFSGGCDCNAVTFKGVFLRHLGELNIRLSPKFQYEAYINSQAESNLKFNKNPMSQFGIHFAGPLEDVHAATTQSSFEALIAQHKMNFHKKTHLNYHLNNLV